MYQDRRILLIENDSLLGSVFKSMFEKLGVPVTWVINDDEALAFLDKETFHTIMIDQHSLDHCNPDFLPSLPSLIRQKTHLFFLVYDEQSIPQIDHPDAIGVQYLHVPVEPGKILDNISGFHLGRGVIDFPKLDL